MKSDKPKLLRIGFLTPVLHLDPATAHDVESSFVLRHIFSAPFDVAYGSTEIEPRLLRGPLQGEGLQWEARVRDDVFFSDGVRLDAAHVADSLRAAALVTAQASVRSAEDRLLFTLERPHARFDLALSHFECSVVRRVGSQLVGTGPYMLSPGSSAELVRLVRNPHYRPAPPIEEVHFCSFTPDPDGRAGALLAALEKGAIDLSLSLGRQDIEAARGVRKSILPGVSTAVLFLNTESPRLRDARLRQALARAIDRLELARSSYANPLAFAATSLTPRSLGPADDHLTFDLPAAQALLAAAGPVRPAKLDLLLTWAPRPYLPYPHKVARLVVEMIGKLGIPVAIHQPSSSEEFVQAVLRGTYDVVLSGWVADTMDPHDFLEALLAEDRIMRADNRAVACNMGRLRSAAMDLALARFRGAREAQNLAAIVDVLNREAPLVPLMYGPAAAAHTYRVRHFKPSPLWYVPVERLDVDDV